MGGQDVLAVTNEVQRADLPVRFGAPTVRRREHLHALRRTREERLDVPGDVAEIVRQRLDAFVPAAENQPLEVFDAGNARQPITRKIEAFREVLVESRGHQPAGPLVGPAVIRADEVARISGIGPADLRAAMPAAVEEGADRHLPVAADEDRHMPHFSRNEVARLRDLGLVRQEDPGAVENPLHLQPAHVIADEDVPAHQTALNVDPTGV